MMRLSGPSSGGARRLVLGGNFGDPSCLPADAEPQCSNPGAAVLRDSGQGSLRTRAAVPSGRRRPGSTFGGNLRTAVPYARITPVVALKMRRVFSREDAAATSAADWRRLRTGHAERASPTCRGVRHRHVPSSGGGERRRCCWGQLQCGHFQEGVTPVVAPGCVPWPFRGQRGGSRALELAPELPRLARIRRFAPVVARMHPTAPSGTGGQLQATGIILQRRHAPCDNPPFATPTCHQPLRAAWCAHAPFGGRDPNVWSGAPSISLGRCDAKPSAPCASLGRYAASQSAPASRPCLSWEAGWRRCAATATSYADGGAGAPRGT
jgi:hypothetical protein